MDATARELFEQALAQHFSPAS